MNSVPISATKVKRLPSRTYDGQFRPDKFSIELKERIRESEQRLASLKDFIAYARANGRSLMVAQQSLALEREQRLLAGLKVSLARELEREQAELLDPPHGDW